MYYHSDNVSSIELLTDWQIAEEMAYLALRHTEKDCHPDDFKDDVYREAKRIHYQILNYEDKYIKTYKRIIKKQWLKRNNSFFRALDILGWIFTIVYSVGLFPLVAVTSKEGGFIPKLTFSILWFVFVTQFIAATQPPREGQYNPYDTEHLRGVDGYCHYNGEWHPCPGHTHGGFRQPRNYRP